MRKGYPILKAMSSLKAYKLEKADGMPKVRSENGVYQDKTAGIGYDSRYGASTRDGMVSDTT